MTSVVGRLHPVHPCRVWVPHLSGRLVQVWVNIGEFVGTLTKYNPFNAHFHRGWKKIGGGRVSENCKFDQQASRPDNLFHGIEPYLIVKFQLLRNFGPPVRVWLIGSHVLNL